jgi:hypothetical protein
MKALAVEHFYNMYSMNKIRELTFERKDLHMASIQQPRVLIIIAKRHRFDIIPIHGHVLV